MCSLAIMILCVAIMPHASPNFFMLVIFRSVLSMTVQAIQVNPLIVDYVKNESRGLMISFAGSAVVFGELLMIILFSATRSMQMNGQYMAPAIIIAGFASIIVFLIREPKIKHPPIENNNPENGPVVEMTFWGKLALLSRDTWNECKNRPKYPFTFICLVGTRLISILFSVYMQLWIMSFVETGVLETKSDSEAIYMKVMAISMVTLAIVGPVFGYMSNSIDSRVLIPISFLSRAICAISFRFIEDPSEWPAMVLCVLISVVSTV